MVEAPKYSTGDQANLSYLPLYQNQNLQDNNSAYAYKSLAASCLPAKIASNGHNLPLFQGWNQETNLPLYSDSSNELTYNHLRTRNNQKNLQLYHATPHPTSLTNTTDKSTSQQTELNNQEYNKVLCNTHTLMHNASHTDVGPSTMDFMNSGQSILKRGFGDSSNPRINLKSELSINSEAETTEYIPRQQSDSYSPCVTPPKTYINTLKTSDIAIHSNFENSTPKDLAPPNITNNKETDCEQENRFQSKSVADLRKEAQRAILNLLPYGVKYETYLKEGFNKDLLESLFKDLDIENTFIADISSNALKSDHYARKQSLADNADITKDSLKASSETTVAKTVSKSSQMAEKERTLQSKMLALRKAREARASAKTTSKPTSEQTPENQVPANPTAPEVLPKSPIGIETSLDSKKYTRTKDMSVPNIATKTMSKTTSDSCSVVSESSLSKPDIDKLPSQTLTIPGLFLVSNPSDTADRPPDEKLIKQRKRPVASDFDDPKSSVTPFKRPFGQSRSEQRIVIDVSDDESEDEDLPMHIGSQRDQNSPVESSLKISSISQIRQSSSNLSGRKTSTPPLNSSSYMTSNHTKQSALAPSILKQKQKEIQLMKKKIAVAEAHLKAKAEIVAGAEAPRIESNTPESRDNCDRIDELTGSETRQEHPDGDDKSKAQYLVQTSQTAVSIIEESVESSEKYSEERTLRRKKIADKLPIIESEVLIEKSRLEQLRTEISKVEAGLKIKMEEKRRMNLEMESLRQDQDAIFEENQDLKEQSDLLCDSQSVEKQRKEDSLRPPSIEHGVICLDKSSISHLPQSAPSLPALTEPDNKTQNSDLAETILSSKPSEDAVEASGITTKEYDEEKSIANDQQLEEVLPEAVRVLPDNSDISTRGINEQRRSLDLCHNDLALNTAETLIEDQPGSVYTPEIAEGPESESDNYEPPDATAPQRLSPQASPPFSPAPPQANEQIKDCQIEITDPERRLNLGIQDDSNVAALQSDSSVIKPLSDDLIMSQKKDCFVSYQSPLKIFRAYRFHPNFKKETTGGLRSMTYSHKIDSSKEFCRFEIAGGICNDSACHYQHFKSIILPDDGIMAALGSPSEFTGERRDKFVAGLREVLLDLRLRKVNDFDTIASEIIAHRSKFLGDQSKVLALEGTII